MLRIALTTSFITAFMLLIAAFITATSYTQLGVAALFYPLLAFFAYKIFIGKAQKVKVAEKVETHTDKKASVVADINKRTFLKLVGATGISFLLISIFGRRIESTIFNQNFGQAAQTASPKGNSVANSTPSSPTDGYNISEVDNSVISYYGFINSTGAWFIMQGDSNTGSFRYAEGGSNFSTNWKNRDKLKYDYFHKVFTSN